MQNMWISIVLIVLVIVLGLIAGARLSTPGPQRRAVYFAFGTLAVLAIWFFLFVAFFPAEWIVPFFTVACIVIPICVYMAVARSSQKPSKKAAPSKKSFEIPKRDIPAESPKEAPAAKPAAKPSETPAAKPAEQPAETSPAQPAMKPAAQSDAKPAPKPAEPTAETAPKKTGPSHAPAEKTKPTETQQPTKAKGSDAAPAPASSDQPVKEPIKEPAAKASLTTADKPTEKPARKMQETVEKKASAPTTAPLASPSNPATDQISAAADIDILVNKTVAEEIDDLEELVRPFGAPGKTEAAEQDQGPDLNIGSPVSSSATPESLAAPTEPVAAPMPTPAPAPVPAPTAAPVPMPTPEPAATPAPAPATTSTPAAAPVPAPAPQKPAKKMSAEESFAEFSARAAALRDQGAYAIAAMLYEEAAALAPTANDTRNTQFDELACYVKAGDAKKAKELAAKLRQSSVLTRFERIKLDAVERMG